MAEFAIGTHRHCRSARQTRHYLKSGLPITQAPVCPAIAEFALFAEPLRSVPSEGTFICENPTWNQKELSFQELNKLSTWLVVTVRIEFARHLYHELCRRPNVISLPTMGELMTKKIKS